MTKDVLIEDMDSQKASEQAVDSSQGSTDIDALIEERIAAALIDSKKQIAGLNRKNSELDAALREKGKTAQTVEERLRELESQRAHEQLVHSELEAFTEAKIDADWLKPFHTDDPYERASLMRDLLEKKEQQVMENMSKQFGSRLPAKQHKLADKSKFNVNELAGLSDTEINRLFAEGKVQGF